jgi:hypothetical protein
MSAFRRSALLGCLLAAAIIPSAALAASATPGGEYSNQKTLDFATVSKNGKKAALNVNPGKCAHGASMKSAKPGKIKGKKLTYSGKVSNLAGDKGKVVLTGTFTNAKTLKWTAKVTVGSCHAKLKSTLKLG